ncbi:hypothetical protein HYDPIDRAFT_119478 [Hydnomerulius pinastri MD-312]|uniref:Uncharacterized protein n=1 Tax=Hydnomerulius pinastri MD-312 TaxID=994086 RepID=A0A0C9VLK8_9AGAM|nr:hypothetical protein HYDPIDRAFT_119478 [Hydnomerulius pinastri MD-312]
MGEKKKEEMGTIDVEDSQERKAAQMSWRRCLLFAGERMKGWAFGSWHCLHLTLPL